MTKIICNPFVKRQIQASSFSHYQGSWESLEALCETHFGSAVPGYKEGIWRIPVPSEGFFCGVIKLRAGVGLQVEFKSRRADEDPFIHVTAYGPKAAAKAVDVIVYSKGTLGEYATNIPCDYEIISINARITDEAEPMSPMAMARNHLDLVGGTKAEYSADEFARSIVFWSQHAMRAE